MSRSDKDTIISLLKDRPIAYRPGLKRIAGSIGAAIMLSQAIYWQERVPRDDGWWWKTAKEWEEETALNLSEERTARAKLRGTSFWGEKRKGIPARMWFKLDFDELVRVLREGLVPLSAEEIVERHKQDIAQIAKAGLMRARKIDAEAEYVNYSEIVLRDGALCAICNKPITRGPGQLTDCLHFHHQMPLSKGGKHAADNIVCAHAQCNLRQGDTYIEQKQQDQLGKDDKIAYAKETNSETTTETTTDTKNPSGQNTPTSFQGWLTAIKESKNRPAILRWMVWELYPGKYKTKDDVPDYGYLGKVAKKVGGAGRLADLLWQHSTRPPTGKLLAFIQGCAKRQGKASKEPYAGIKEWVAEQEVVQ